MSSLHILRVFFAVYLVSFSAIALDVYLLAQTPQGFHLCAGMTSAICECAALTIAGIYASHLSRRGMAAIAFSLANIACVAPFNQLAHLAPAYIGRNLPTIDDALMRCDMSLGFDWVSYFQWQTAHPVVGRVCRVAYLVWPQVMLLVAIALATRYDIDRLARYLIATTISLMVVYLIAIVTPSYGAYVQHGMSASFHPDLFVQFSDYKPVYDALRKGIVDLYAADIPSGAISFPSFHTTTVILCIWGAWRMPLRWAVCVVEGLCFLAIPVQGAHFATDMIMGALIGVVSICVSAPIVTWAGLLPDLVVERRNSGRPRLVCALPVLDAPPAVAKSSA